ncbi:MAG: alpha-ketoacid dehydrogenase subunit beta [Candidatus Ranarchaeia archaeon]
MTKRTLIQAINQALDIALEMDEDTVVLGEDVGVDGGVFRATVGLIEKYGNDRVIDTPLSESGIVGAAIGMAVSGLKPIVEIQFSGFLPPTFDQLLCHAARIRTRSRGRYSCPLVLRTPYGAGIRAPEHHSESLESILIHIPGLKVVVPSTPKDAKGLLLSAVDDPDPVIFFEPKRLYRAIREDVPDEAYRIPLAKASIVREGNDVTLISWGAMVPVCLQAAQLIYRTDGTNVEVIDLRTLKPFDKDAVLASSDKTGRVVIVHEAPRTLGFGAEISALINERALLRLKAPVLRVTGYDTPPPLARLEDYYLPDSVRIIFAIRRVMTF